MFADVIQEFSFYVDSLYLQLLGEISTSEAKQTQTNDIRAVKFWDVIVFLPRLRPEEKQILFFRPITKDVFISVSFAPTFTFKTSMTFTADEKPPGTTIFGSSATMDILVLSSETLL